MIKTGGFLAQSSPTKIADDVASTLRYEKFRAVLLAVLGGIAWLLGAAGVVVVVATTVRRSAREIAIRRALGAQSWDIVRVSSARVLLPLTMGSVVGLGIVVALRSASRSVLLSVPTIDAMSIAIVVLLLGVMAGTAGIFPIRSALLSLPADLLRRDS
jgi:ABC-type antimicrobial peptide transport system permease subunit